MGFLHSSVGKESACNAGDPGSIPGSGRSPGEGNGNPLQYACLENPMDREACWTIIVHGIARVRHNLATKPPPQSPQRDLQRTEKHTGTTEAAFLYCECLSIHQPLRGSCLVI